jgi:hypothetical protein
MKLGYLIFYATFNNISVTSWRLVLLLSTRGENTDLPQVSESSPCFHKFLTLLFTFRSFVFPHNIPSLFKKRLRMLFSDLSVVNQIPKTYNINKIKLDYFAEYLMHLFIQKTYYIHILVTYILNGCDVPYKLRIQTSDYRFERHFPLYRDGVFYWWRKPE